MKKKIRVRKPRPTFKGHCSIFTSYFCPEEIHSSAFEFSKYDQRKKETEEACKKSVDSQVTGTMNLEFMAYDMLHFGFCMGYVMGELYNIKDRKHLPVLRRFFRKHLLSEDVIERKKAERKGLPYVGGPNQKKIEKRAA
jgi:hypothetical protein